MILVLPGLGWNEAEQRADSESEPGSTDMRASPSQFRSLWASGSFRGEGIKPDAADAQPTCTGKRLHGGFKNQGWGAGGSDSEWCTDTYQLFRPSNCNLVQQQQQQSIAAGVNAPNVF